MAVKMFSVICVSAILIQTIVAQCVNSYAPPPFVGPHPNSGTNVNHKSPIASGLTSAVTNAGSFTVTSSSPIAPSGVSVVSEYVIEGPLSVTGELPVMSAIGVDGQLATGGKAGTSYSCGKGNVGIVRENFPSVSALGAGNSAAGSLSAKMAGGNLDARLGQRNGCV